jgi:peptide chain release factor
MAISPEKQLELQLRLAKLGVRQNDIEEHFVRAQGPGGQKVNKANVAVFLKHLPSGIEIKAQQSRSQSLNRFYARRQLAELLEAQILGKDAPKAKAAEKIRKQKQRRKRRHKGLA